jgi:hypothetical protein
MKREIAKPTFIPDFIGALLICSINLNSNRFMSIDPIVYNEKQSSQLFS